MTRSHQLSIAKIYHPVQSHQKSITQKFKARDHYDNIILKKLEFFENFNLSQRAITLLDIDSLEISWI